MGRYSFTESPETGVIACSRVLDEGATILYVSHDADGDWQFLCGAEHGDGTDEQARLVHLNHLVERDDSLNDLADLCPHWWAERDSSKSSWKRVDGLEQVVRNNIADYGWHVMGVGVGDGSPEFSYSIGMWETLGCPELLCLGLPSRVAHEIINDIGELVRRGEKLRDGDQRDDVFKGYPCRFRSVEQKHYGGHVGYAIWYYATNNFPVLQVVYPNRQGVFPEELEANDDFLKAQPILWASRGRPSV